MKIEEEGLYHIYNRGNHKQQLFFHENNYLSFLGKIREKLLPVCDILAWCLMPNHYHFLVYANEISAALIENRPLPISNLSEAFRLIQSGYTKAVNAEFEITGNLFHQKFKSKQCKLNTPVQGVNTFHYIHENATKAGLVTKKE